MKKRNWYLTVGLCLTALPKDTGILGAAMVGQR